MATSPDTLASIEEAWAEVLCVRGDLVVALDRGEASAAVDAGRQLVERVDVLSNQALALDPALLTTDEQAPYASIVDGLRGLVALNADSSLRGEATVSTRTEAAAPAVDDPATAARRTRMRAAYTTAASSLPVDGETVDRLTIVERLTKLEDGSARRRHFLSLDPVWRTVAGPDLDGSPYQLLIQETAARWARGASPIDEAVGSLGFTVGELEPLLWQILGAWRVVLGESEIEPWNFRFAYGAAARQLHDLTTPDRFQALNDTYLETLGVSADGIAINYDLFPRPGRPEIAVAHAVYTGPRRDDSGKWIARSPWVFATYRSGGLANLTELLHETGHALHLAGGEARPAFADVPSWGLAWFESLADVVGWDVEEPAWQEHWLGASATAREAVLHRYGAIVLDICWALFEIAMYRDPWQSPNNVWGRITSEGLGIIRHDDLAWWATRGQLISLPGYMVNYALSAIVAAAVRERMRGELGDWVRGNRRWYRHLRDAFYRHGFAARPEELVRTYLDRPLGIDPLLRDLDRGRHPVQRSA